MSGRRHGSFRRRAELHRPRTDRTSVCLHATRQVDRLMVASIWRIHTHGIFRLTQYMKRIRAGGINVTPTVTTVANPRHRPGRRGQRHGPPGGRIRDETCDHRRGTPAAPGSARGDQPRGCSSDLRVDDRRCGLIGLRTNGSANHMAPWGSADLLLGTNAAAIPAKDGPHVVMDIATTVSSFGRVRTARAARPCRPTG